MDKRKWKTKLKKACTEAGTYQPYFEHAIDTLSGILEKRDEAAEMLEDEKPIIKQTNKAGYTNIVKNPAYTVWDEMNKQALAYLKELGLTPAGLHKINEEVFQKAKNEKAANNLIDLLNKRKTNE